jgi:hypothetical protein
LAGQEARVRVRFLLQDEVIGRMIVVAQHDRPLGDAPIAAPIPRVTPGRTDERYVVLENVSRDEVVLDSSTDVREISRQQPEWRKLSNVLGSEITKAFLASDATETPSLSFRTRQRVVVETAEARIRMAETLLVMDANGIYRGRRTYHIDNKTEQYLDLKLPQDAALWTVTVAGTPVKPVRAADSAATGTVRIPLLKTAAGDLDYLVQVKFGGEIPAPRRLQPSGFPLIHTINIHVEQSQVRLRLPETHRWFDFDGTMRQVHDEGDLAAGFFPYQTRQIESLNRVLSNKGVDKFTRVRAASNLKKAVEAAESFQDLALGRYANNDRLQEEIDTNSMALRDAEEQISGVEQEVRGEVLFANRDRLLGLGQSQTTQRGKNVVMDLGSNFYAAGTEVAQTPVEQQPAEPPADEKGRFDVDWFRNHRLAEREDAQDRAGMRRFREYYGAKDNLDSVAPPQAQLEAFGTRPESFGDQSQQSQQQLAVPQQQRDDVKEQLQRYQRKLERTKDSRTNQSVRVLPMFAQDAPVPAQEVGGFAASMLGVSKAASAATGWSSLEVELPERGVEYLFTTVRGEIDVTARAIAADRYFNGIRIARILALVLGIGLAVSVVRRINRQFSTRIRAVVLTLLGLISLVGFLPLLGLIAVCAGVWMLIREELVPAWTG